MFVYGVELAAADGVEEDFSGFLDTFEERVVLSVTGGSFLVRVMAKHFLAVGTFDLVFCGSVTVFGEAEDGIVVLSLLATRKVST